VGYFTNNSLQRGFTIVELMVVVFVIGIVASVALISYNGISQKATETAVQSDLRGASRLIQLFQVTNGLYPETINCEQPESSTNICIKFDSGATVQSYTYDNVSYPPEYSLTIGKDQIVYEVDENNQIVSSYYDPDISASTGGGNPIENEWLYAEGYPSWYLAPTVEGTVKEWNVGTNVYTANDINAYTSINGRMHEFKNFGFACSGNAFKGIAVILEASATTAAGTITVALSRDGGSNYVASKTTSTLSVNDTMYTLGSTADSWGYGGWTVADCSSGNFVVRVTANTDNNGIRIDKLTALYQLQSTGGGAGGGGAI
jgi:prepilin-type N-terminal cleavage/methylation domain-containing protein